MSVTHAFPRRRTGWGGRIVRVLLVLGCVGPVAALGWIRHADRARIWRKPRWNDAGFTLVRGEPAPASRGERWVVAVNPRCPHCRTGLTRLLAEPRDPGAVRVEALIVDTPERPSPAVIADPRVAAVWWDSRNAWRELWGHRVYGERLVFDARGGYLRTEPPREPREGAPAETDPR